jgi:lipopolysaccharide exporter
VVKLNNTLQKISRDNKSFLTLVSGTTIAQAINLCFTPVITRLFSPGVFGDIAIFNAIISIASIVVCLRYELSIVIPELDNEAASLFKLSCVFASIFTVFLFIALYFWGASIFVSFGASNLFQYWYYFPITVFLCGITQVFISWMTRKKEYGKISFSSIATAFTVNIVSISLALFGNDSVSTRLFATFLSLVIGLVVFLAQANRTMRGLWARPSYSWLPLVKKYKNFLVFDVWAALINNLSWAMVPLLITSFFSSYEAGQYSVGLRVIQIPMSIIGASISRVFLQVGNEKRQKGELFHYSISSMKRMFYLTSVPLVIVLLFGSPLFKFVFGQEWGEAGLYSQILVPWALIWFCASPLHGIFTVTQRQNVYLVFAVFNFVTRLISIYIGSINNSITLALYVFSASGVLVYGGSLFIALRAAIKSDSYFRMEISKS